MLLNLFKKNQNEVIHNEDQYNDVLVAPAIEENKYQTYNYQTTTVLENEVIDQEEEVLEDLDILFAMKFIEKKGKFVFCENKEDLFGKLQMLLKKINKTKVFVWEQELVDFLKSNNLFTNGIMCERNGEESNIAISKCEVLIANEGSIMLNPMQNSPRSLNIFPSHQILFATLDQLAPNVDKAIEKFVANHNDSHPFVIQLDSDPKRLRNINGKFVINSEGPKEIFLFLCETL